MKSDIVLAGVGGQGILTIATILGHAALREGLHIKQAEVHGMSQRGGDVQSNLRISSSPIASDLSPLGGADLIVSLEPMEALRYLEDLNPATGWAVSNTTPFVNINNYPAEEAVMAEFEQLDRVVAFDMDTVAREEASPRSSNIVLLGAASPLIGISAESIEQSIAAVFASKPQAVIDSNMKAFRAGRARALELMKR